MNIPHRTFSILSAIVIALAAGFFFISAHGPSTEAAPHAAPHHDDAVSPAAHVSHVPDDQHALSDMYAYASLRLGSFREIPDSFGGTTEWSHAWILKWLDVEHDGQMVRLYHITDRDNPQHRLVAVTRAGSEEPVIWEDVP